LAAIAIFVRECPVDFIGADQFIDYPIYFRERWRAILESAAVGSRRPRIGILLEPAH
jgi:hypothetical protein